MLYPIMPIYLKQIGFSIFAIGILEGFAEAIAGLSKGYFGKLSDIYKKRVPFVQFGYTLSAISKPMMAIILNPIWIFIARTLDRFGKGIRTGARDAILSEEATSQTKGKIFGFHRSMDTTGAVLGPTLALIYLYFFPENYVTLFYIAFIPGLFAIITSSILKEKGIEKPEQIPKVNFFSFLKYWKVSSLTYRKVVIGLLAFTLFNSSDFFLLLKIKQAGLNDTYVIGIYIFYNLVYALFSFPLGIIADKIGLKIMFTLGLAIFAIVYLGMTLTSNMIIYISLFFLYGIYAAATEGISKAWISNITNKNDVATAIGTYAGFNSICSMIASSLAGFIWFTFGSNATFTVTGLSVILVIIYFYFFVKSDH